jgi:ubiquinol-cytochrome c reductase cytochrome b subunit
VESGVIMMSPDGRFSERHEAPREEEKVVILSKENTRPEAPARDAAGIPAPGTKGPLGHLRSRLNRAWTFDDIPIEEHGDGHEEHKEIESGATSHEVRH